MMNAPLYYTPLETALETLNKALKEAEKDNGDYAEYVRDAVIQRFEYSYELAWKTMKRFLKMYRDVDENIIAEIYRYAMEGGVIEDASVWMQFHKARNLTPHTYNQATAKEVFDMAAPFYKAAKEFLEKVKQHAD